MPFTVLICAALAALAVVGVLSYRKRLKSGCCGAADGKAVKKVRVADKNRSHYPYRAVLRIDGMTCENCTRRVGKRPEHHGGVWATADLYKGRAEVLMKRPVPQRSCGRASTRRLYGACGNRGRQKRLKANKIE